MIYDVVIIGGGVIGSSIARALSRYEAKVGVLEKNLDVCNETSGRNSAVIHGGFAYDEGTLKAKLCLEGNLMMDELCEELDVPFSRCGKVLVGNTKEDMEQLERTLFQGTKNGVSGLSIIDKDELKKLVPNAVGEFAMFSRNSGIIDPFIFTIALAENAVSNGVDYFFNSEVLEINRKDELWEIVTENDVFMTQWVINSAGLNCAKVSDMLGIKGYNVIGSKGDYIVLDKKTGAMLEMPIYPVPSNTYMGIHVTNTVDGNVTVGPNAETVSDFEYYGISKENMDYLAESASKIWPHIHKKDYIRNYSGILPKWVDENGKIQDFKIEIKEDIAPNAINLVGIESPGLTAAYAIGKYVVDMLLKYKPLKENKLFNPKRETVKRFVDMSEEEQNRAILENSDYGELICRCEKVTKAEILHAINNPLCVSTVLGIKYRTRAMMGRCQGGYCQTRITELLMLEKNIAKEDILYSKKGSYMFTGDVCSEV